MERDDHIHLVDALIIRNVPHQERQLLIAVLLRQFSAVFDHILFQIQADNADIVFFQLMQIIIHGKCEIRFSASEIEDRKLSLLIELRKDIFDKFQEPVDLAEFVRLRPDDLPVLCHHPQISEERHRDPFFQDIMFLTVVGQIRRLRLLPALLFLNGGLSFLADEHRIYVAHRLYLHLAELLCILGKLFFCLLFFQISVKCLFRRKRLKLEQQLPFLLKRPDFHLYYALFIPRVADHRTDKIYI